MYIHLILTLLNKFKFPTYVKKLDNTPP